MKIIWEHERGMTSPRKPNCWEVIGCGWGPDSSEPCPAALDTTSDGVNSGANAGRICWTVTGTRGGQPARRVYPDKLESCLDCEFFQRVKAEEGDGFRFLKLGQGLLDPSSLHAKIDQIEAFMRIRERLYAQFDLPALLASTSAEVMRVANAENSVVFLRSGHLPELHGHLYTGGRDQEVVVPLDETSAVGTCALQNRVVNVRAPYDAAPAGTDDAVFSERFDRVLGTRTHSLVAIPIRDPDERVIGVLTAANSRKGYFSADDQWFVQRYALEVALAVQKARLIEESLSGLRLASIGESVAGLSHCMKGIAHALKGSSYVMRRALESGRMADARVAWEILDRHVARLADLSIAVFSLDAQDPAEPGEGSLNETVRNVASLWHGAAQARCIALETQLDSQLERCRTDTRAIYRCLVSLIANAFDACPMVGGRVLVSTRAMDGNWAAVSVADNGRGMDEATKRGVFDLFQTAQGPHGSGSGLPIVADVVQKMNGRVEVQSARGEGTTLRLVIPVSSPS